MTGSITRAKSNMSIKSLSRSSSLPNVDFKGNNENSIYFDSQSNNKKSINAKSINDDSLPSQNARKESNSTIESKYTGCINMVIGKSNYPNQEGELITPDELKTLKNCMTDELAKIKVSSSKNQDEKQINIKLLSKLHANHDVHVI